MVTQGKGQKAFQRLYIQGVSNTGDAMPSLDDSRSLVRNFLDVFPYATLWTSGFHEMLLVGSMEPIELDAAKISQRFQQDTVRSTLQDVGIGSAAALPRDIREVMRGDGGNPYFRWFVGGVAPRD